MKKLLKYLTLPFSFLAVFFAGFFIRQPQVNKMKKQIRLLQNQLSDFQGQLKGYQDSFNTLYIQFKGLKLMQLKKKAEYENQLKDNLVLQYGIKDYINLLFEKTDTKAKFKQNELDFYNAFDNVIEGKEVSPNDFLKIKEYILDNHKKEIDALKLCNCTEEFRKLEDYKKKNKI